MNAFILICIILTMLVMVVGGYSLISWWLAPSYIPVPAPDIQINAIPPASTKDTATKNLSIIIPSEKPHTSHPDGQHPAVGHGEAVDNHHHDDHPHHLPTVLALDNHLHDPHTVHTPRHAFDSLVVGTTSLAFDELHSPTTSHAFDSLMRPTSNHGFGTKDREHNTSNNTHHPFDSSNRDTYLGQKTRHVLEAAPTLRGPGVVNPSLSTRHAFD